MNCFADTSIFLPYVDEADEQHDQAAELLKGLFRERTRLFTSNYVLLETHALLQRRFGMNAVRDFEQALTTRFNVLWIDSAVHQAAVSTLLAANRRQLSLVDCTSFEIMRRHHIHAAATFDQHFEEQGFEVLPVGARLRGQ